MYGLMDLVVILVILVIVFGAKWLPVLGAGVGRALARRAAARARVGCGQDPVAPATPPAAGPVSEHGNSGHAAR
jgi:hypothetical protein